MKLLDVLLFHHGIRDRPKIILIQIVTSNANYEESWTQFNDVLEELVKFTERDFRDTISNTLEYSIFGIPSEIGGK